MKILFLSQIVPYPPHGGVLQRGYNIVREIAKYNDVYLLAFVHPDILNSEELVNESRNVLTKHCKVVEYFSLWPKQSLYHKYLAIISGLFSSLPFSVVAHKSEHLKNKILNIMATENIDLVHFDTIALAQYRDCIGATISTLTHHNVESELMHRRALVEKNTLARHYLNREVKKLQKYEASESKKFNINLMMSSVDESKLKELSPGVNTAIIPNGVDVDYYKPIRGQEGNAIIYTGGMNMFANCDAVLYLVKEVWPILKKAVPDIVFYIVGQDPPLEIINLAKSDSGLKVLGFVDDVRPFVAKAGVYVVPLRVGGGTRLKVLDALSQGKAIVSTSIGCEGIQIKSGKNIVIEDEPDKFANEIIALLCDNNKRSALGENARALAKSNYAWSSIGEKLQDTYLNLLATVGKKDTKPKQID